MAGAIEFLRYQPSMPKENDIGLDDRRNGFERFSSELLADSGKKLAVLHF